MSPAAKETVGRDSALSCTGRVKIVCLMGPRKLKQENNLNELDSPDLGKGGALWRQPHIWMGTVPTLCRLRGMRGSRQVDESCGNSHDEE